MSTDLLDQLRALAAHLDSSVAPVAVDELRPLDMPIEIDTAADTVGGARRYGRLLAMAGAVALVVAAIAVYGGRRPSPAPTTPPVASGTTLAPASTPATAALTTAPSIDPQPTSAVTIPAAGITFAFGGSVMLGAATELARVGVMALSPNSGGGGITRADPRAITRFAESAAAATAIVILQIGDDGPIAQADYERLLSSLADRERVLVLTVHGTGQWFAPNNAFIRALPARFPNVTVVDWDQAVTSGDVPGILADGMHLGMAARTAYAAIVDKALERAQHEAPPPTTTTSTTTPPANGPCEWKATDAGHDGAGGHLASYITLTNVGTHTCSLPKVSAVTVSWPQANVTVFATPGSFFPIQPGPATVAPSVKVSLTLTTTTIDGCTAVSSVGSVARVDVTLSDGAKLHVDLQYYVQEKCGVGFSQLGAL